MPNVTVPALQPEALNYRVAEKTLPEIWQLPINEALDFLEQISLPTSDSTAEMLHGEVCTRLRYLERVGLSYLNLDRPTRTLSGGETERVSLTTCLGASLTSTLFVLDEPTIGLHPRDTNRLIDVMHHLRDNGNTLAVVEHDESVIRAADHLIDIGPGRGEDGGELVFTGSPEQLTQSSNHSLTAAYLSGKKIIPLPKKTAPTKKTPVPENHRSSPAQPEKPRRRNSPSSLHLRNRSLRLRKIDSGSLGSLRKPAEKNRSGLACRTRSL